MTERLRALVAELEKLPPEQQDQWAATFAQSLADDQRWNALFVRPDSQTLFEQLIAEAAQGKREGTVQDGGDTR
jgi:hypothetical protein